MCNTPQKMHQDLTFPKHYQPHHPDNYNGLYAHVSTYPLSKKVVKNVEFDQIFEIGQPLMARTQSVPEMVQTLFFCYMYSRRHFKYLKTKWKNNNRPLSFENLDKSGMNVTSLNHFYLIILKNFQDFFELHW